LQFQASTGKKLQDPSQKKKLAWWHMAVIPATTGSINRRIIIKTSPGKKKCKPISKITRAKRAGGMTQVVEHMPSLDSNPSTSSFTKEKNSFNISF
jgi:hypothetical protein